MWEASATAKTFPGMALAGRPSKQQPPAPGTLKRKKPNRKDFRFFIDIRKNVAIM
jgi:hypothetical protein